MIAKGEPRFLISPRCLALLPLSERDRAKIRDKELRHLSFQAQHGDVIPGSHLNSITLHQFLSIPFQISNFLHKPRPCQTFSSWAPHAVWEPASLNPMLQNPTTTSMQQHGRRILRQIVGLYFNRGSSLGTGSKTALVPCTFWHLFLAIRC